MELTYKMDMVNEEGIHADQVIWTDYEASEIGVGEEIFHNGIWIKVVKLTLSKDENINKVEALCNQIPRNGTDEDTDEDS